MCNFVEEKQVKYPKGCIKGMSLQAIAWGKAITSNKGRRAGKDNAVYKYYVTVQ